MANRIAAACFAMLLGAWPLAVSACDGTPCNSIEQWVKFTSVKMTMSAPGDPQQVSFEARFDHEQNDILVDLDIPRASMKGKVAMVAGRVMMTKDLKLERGVEIDALDGPVLQTVLVMRLLGRVFPDGPDSVPPRKRIERTDPVAVQYATPSASGRIPGPWRLTGTVAKDRPDHIAFDLALSFPKTDVMGNAAKEGGTMVMHMRGALGRAAQPILPDDLALGGWTTYGVGPTEHVSGGSTVLDYGATRQDNPKMKTVADIRAYLAEEFSPGKLDKTKDFTGVWKGKCSDDFGLHIMHYGDEGKYAVLFCGPGGCDDPARETLTFITGDKGYEIVSDDEIRSGRGPDKDRYVRCSRELPPLKIAR